MPGGRVGGISVAGIITGARNSYYTGRHGFVYENFDNAEVVLTNRSNVNANTSSHSDLWKALKGGGDNFGIGNKVLPTSNWRWKLIGWP